MADIFISYSKSEKPLVEELGAFLIECGYTVWWDTELVAGKDFREEIRRQIDSATAVIVVWSRHSRRSDFVIDEADVARRQDKLISTLAKDLTSDGVPLGFRTAHHVCVDDAEGLLLALGQKGLSTAKPVSAYVLRLFKQRLGAIAGRPRRYLAFASLALLGIAILVAGSILLLDRFRELPLDPRQRLQLLSSTSFDGSKGFLHFYFYLRDPSGKRNPETARVANIDIFQFDRKFQQSSKSSTQRSFIFPRDGYELKQEISPSLRQTLESKGIITICADLSFDNGKTFDRIGKIFSIEEIGKIEELIHSVKFDAPDDTLVEAVTRKTNCRYLL